MFSSSLRRFLPTLIVSFMLMHAPFAFALESLGFSDLNKRVEEIEKNDAYNLSADVLAEKIDELRDDLEEYMRDNPDNVDILVLTVRLAYMEEIFVKSKLNENLNISVDPETKFVELHKRLDKAISLHPQYAAAYYWKAALYGMAHSTVDASGKMAKKPVSLEKAIEYARKAVETDQSNQWYRHTLATYLYNAGEQKAALEVIDIPEMASYPVTVLLKDLEAFPLPFGSILSQEDTDSYIELMVRQKSLKNFENLRVRVYVVPLSVDEMNNFYRSKWPNFEFFNRGKDNLYGQYMLVHGDGIRPSAHIGEARAWASQQLGSLMLSVEEINNATEEQRRRTPAGHELPANLGETFSYLYIVNDRKI